LSIYLIWKYLYDNSNMNKCSINSTTISDHTMNLRHIINKQMRSEMRWRGTAVNECFFFQWEMVWNWKFWGFGSIVGESKFFLEILTPKLWVFGILTSNLWIFWDSNLKIVNFWYSNLKIVIFWFLTSKMWIFGILTLKLWLFGF